MVRILMHTLGALVSLYTLLIIVRILLTWFSSPLGYGKVHHFLASVTDPYLNYFRRFSIFQIGRFDFSPVAALIVLSVLGNIFSSIALFGRITLGSILAFTLNACWSVVSFFILLYLFCILLRLFGMLIHSNSTRPFWMTLDMLLSPVLIRIAHLFTKRPIEYVQGLLLGCGVLLGLRVLGGMLIHQVTTLLHRLPF
ncbi:MAG TPA: YggT family protein [Spirochaetales bacterium]|nr:YggT family protein [Spirochaetales bacterium]